VTEREHISTGNLISATRLGQLCPAGPTKWMISHEKENIPGLLVWANKAKSRNPEYQSGDQETAVWDLCLRTAPGVALTPLAAQNMRSSAGLWTSLADNNMKNFIWLRQIAP